MKKVILSIALVAGMMATTSIQAENLSNNPATIVAVSQDSDFVDIKFEELNAKVQASVSALAQEYEFKALKYNAEKQLTKVELTKKDDQSQKTVYFDAEGKEVTPEAAPAEKAQKTEEAQQQPSTEMSDITQDDGFANAKLEELNPKVQAVVKLLAKDFDLNALKYNAKKQLTKVELTKKGDQSKKTIYFDAEGKEVNQAAPAEKAQKVQKTEGVQQQQQQPSAEMYDVGQDDGFSNIKFEQLNEKVQAAVRVIADKYELNALQYNVEKRIAKVKGTNKADKSQKTFFLDAEGKEINMDAAPAETTEKKTEEVEKTEEVQQQQEQQPSAEISDMSQDDGFANIKFEKLNEKVQAAVRAIADKYELNALQYNAEKQITRVKGTNKADKSQKTFLLDSEGKEVNMDAAPAETTEKKTEKVENTETPMF